MKKKNTLTGDILDSLSKYFAVLVLAVVLIIACSGIRIVKSGEVALIFRFGKLSGSTYEEQIHEPGLLFAFPYIIDEVVTVPTGQVRKIEVKTHYTPSMMTGYTHNGYVISGDSNIILLSASVQYMITNPVAYAVNVIDEEKLVNASVSNAMIEIAAGMSSDTLLTTGKSTLAEEILQKAGSILAAADTGITLSSVELTDVSMPAEVKETYEAVNSAKVRSETLKEQAEQYRETVIPGAQSDAAALISAATAKGASDVAEANAYLSEFRGILEQYESEGEAVRVRVYNQKLSEIMQKITDIRLVSDSESKIIIGER